MRQHLKLFAELAGIKRSSIIPRVEEIESKFCLDKVKNEKAGILSDGFKRRLSLGIALIGKNKIVILDDPIAGVDPAST